MKNKELTKTYDKVYREGRHTFHTFDTIAEMRLIFDYLPSWKGLEVLEVGCGEGQLATMIAGAGAARVVAIDYSSEAIAAAKGREPLPNLSFFCDSYRKAQGRFDVVVAQGVLEHLDDPFEELQGIMERNLKPGGSVITSSPSFLNPRGYVWMTLQLLFDVPMSLTDLHFLCPFDFEEFAEKRSYSLEVRSTDYDWGAGERTIVDFSKRLVNALRDAGMDNSKVERLLEWLGKAVKYHRNDEFSGATVAYRICPPAEGGGFGGE